MAIHCWTSPIRGWKFRPMGAQHEVLSSGGLWTTCPSTGASNRGPDSRLPRPGVGASISPQWRRPAASRAASGEGGLILPFLLNIMEFKRLGGRTGRHFVPKIRPDLTSGCISSIGLPELRDVLQNQFPCIWESQYPTSFGWHEAIDWSIDIYPCRVF